jgi:DNA end-binding protein Ku
VVDPAAELGKDCDMARTIWKGALSFGLVNVPVGLYPATQDKTIHFNQFERGTSDRIRYKKINERTGDEVESKDIVKGVDLGGGEYVILTDEELASAEPERSRYIEITDFVSLDEIDPVYFNTTYYLAPEGESAGKAYALLRQAMQESGKVAIATFVMRNKEYLVAVRPEADVLALETMYFSDEVRSPTAELPNLPAAEAATDQELQMANLLIGSMESDWEPQRYHDTHRAKVEALIDEKAQGKTIAVAKAPQATKVVDLMEALSASIKAKSGEGKTPSRAKPAAPSGASVTRVSAKVPAAKKAAKAPAAKSARRKAS